MKLANIAFRNIKRNRRRSILSGIAIGIAAMTIVLLFAFEGGMMKDMKDIIINYMTGHIRIRDPEYDKYENLTPFHLGVPEYEKIVEKLGTIDNIETVAPRIQFPTGIYSEEEKTTFGGFGLGGDIDTEVELLSLDDYLASGGDFPKPGTREVALSSGLAEELGKKMGDDIVLFTKTRYMGSNGMRFKITGIIHFPINAYNKKFFLMPIDTVQTFLKMTEGNLVTEINIKVKNESKLKQTVSEINAMLKEIKLERTVTALSWLNIGFWPAIIQLADVAYGFIALFFFLIGTTVIINTTMMVIFERMKEIGTISAMGMSGGEIVRLFFLEAFFISVIASLIGVVIGTAIAAPMAIYGIDFSVFTESIDFQIPDRIYATLDFRSTIFVFFYSVAVASLVSIIPSRRAAKIQPVEALRAL